MEWSAKIVDRLPLERLWTARGPVDVARARAVGQAEITDLLREGPVRFVVADVGQAPRWVPEPSCHAFWKSEVKAHLVPAGAESWRLEQFPGEYAYLASEWRGTTGSPIVVLEVSH